MTHVIPELDTIDSQLIEGRRSEKPKILVVDDEPDNLDLLYRTFRRDFQVFKASSGKDALTILTTEGEVAVIISDQRMPEMKGTEFLSRTVPQFPNTVRIILTGFTDVEDLVEAINSGQVYKYITKPWDPNELKEVVRRATETYELLRQRTDELSRAQKQAYLLKALVEIPRDTNAFTDCLEKIATVFGNTFSTNQCTIQQVINNQLSEIVGQYAAPDCSPNTVNDDPLVQEAIASQSIKLFIHNSAAARHGEYYAAQKIGTHLVVPLIAKNTVVFVISLQWLKDFVLSQEDISILYLLSNQLALVLSCIE
ncbi:MAG: response regulator [Leptolyngbyaceae bacterium]|nr:response regulator [Leptolyngbyaceae bacterium]